jgi:hypothetical protein
MAEVVIPEAAVTEADMSASQRRREKSVDKGTEDLRGERTAANRNRQGEFRAGGAVAANRQRQWLWIGLAMEAEPARSGAARKIG